MTTETTTWSEPTDDDSIDVVSLLAAIIVAMAIAGFTMLRQLRYIVEMAKEDSDYSKDEY